MSKQSSPRRIRIMMRLPPPLPLLLLLLSLVVAAARAQVVFQGDVVVPTMRGDVPHRLVLFAQDEPVDVLEQVREQYYADRAWRHALLAQICRQPKVRCTRDRPVVFSTRIEGGDASMLGTLEILEGVEPVDALAQFAAHHGLARTHRRQILDAICRRPELKCTKFKSLIYRQGVHGDGGQSMGTLEIFDDSEPVDQIHRFVIDNKLPEHAMDQLVGIICARVACERKEPMVYSRLMANSDQHVIGRLEIMKSQEPADVVHVFGLHYRLDKHFRQSALHAVCADPYVTCNRMAPYVFVAPIVVDNGTNVGVLRVKEDEELADAVYQFAKESNITLQLRASLFQQLCGQGSILCTRGQALLRTMQVADANNNVVGEIAVYEGQEPADAVYHFAQQHGLTTADADNVVDVLCGTSRTTQPKSGDQVLDCSRYYPVVYAVPIAAQNGSRLGILEVLSNDEPADAIARFGNKHGLGVTEKGNILDAVCKASGLPCTRKEGILYQTTYTLPNGHVERIDFVDGYEPTDLIYNYGLMRNLTQKERKKFLVEVCNEPRRRPNCTRAEPMLLSIPVWETSEKKMGDLEILEGQEPIDMVYAFLEKHDLFQTEPLNTTLLQVVCNSTRVQCVRDRPRRILFSMQATYAGIQHTLQYVQPESDWICESLHGGQQCVHYVEVLTKQFCSTHMHDWLGCEPRILEALRSQLAFYEERMWRGKDLYAKLGLVKTATREEIDVAYNRLVKRFNNETEPHKYDKLREAYATLSDPEEKYFYDLPCLKLFGLCGKKKKDGSISISAD